MIRNSSEKGGYQWWRNDERYPEMGKGIIVYCPQCGGAGLLKIGPFTFNESTLTIGPASVRLPCGWHGYVTNGNWNAVEVSPCTAS